ncbi:MAG: hypothetical protein K2X55_00965 [Burkholderiaceae bacterium]|nr:hypothetical protein [Burkholderiaceae bacterium]
MPNPILGTLPAQAPRNCDLGGLAYLDPKDITPGFLHVRDEKASGTSAGNATGGAYNDRTLNTVVANTIAGASLASNQVTLPPGTYEFSARAPGYGNVGASRLSLYNVTDAATVLQGDTSSGATPNSWALCDGRFTITAAKVVKLRQWFGSSFTDGQGSASFVAGVAEVYASLIIRKVA